MTTGHKHRVVKVKRAGLVHRVLKHPLWWTTNLDKADKSRFVHGPRYPETGPDAQVWEVTVLGLLHPLTGLTLEVRD